MSSTSAAEITRKSGSNLALAFVFLPKQRRDDMVIFYAFCREVDDIADATGNTVAQREAELNAWRAALRGQGDAGPPGLAGEVRGLLQRRSIPVELLDDLITGMDMDMIRSRYETFEELEKYCYHVAGAVGLACLRIFGADPERADAYARTLGLGLQLTNILRDIGEDLREYDRVYVPQEELRRFGLSDENLRTGTGERMGEFLKFQADRARRTLDQAGRLLPEADRRELLTPEIMRAVYGGILDKMRADGLQVFRKRYRLSKLRKICIMLATRFRGAS